MDQSALEKVEAKRKELEATIARLRKSLRHWQTLELDYEGLREEFQLLRGDVSEEKCLQVARDFRPEALHDKDLEALMKDSLKHPSVRPQQLAHVLEKRVEYVSRNVKTIRKQLEGEQRKLNAILLAEDPDTQDHAGLPLGEITEELDESGKVISSKVEHAGGKAADLAEVLEKVGVTGLSERDGRVTAAEDVSSVAKAQPENTLASSSTQTRSETPAANQQPTAPAAEIHVQSDVPAAGDKSDTIPDLGSDTSSAVSLPTNPADTEEEALLRQAMVDYNPLDDMRAIVAELDLAEGASDVSYDEDSDNPNLVPDSNIELDDDDEDEDDNSEDDQGASKRLHLSSAYQKQMEQLQEKLGLKDVKNLGPKPDLPDDVKREVDRLNTERPAAAEATRKAALKRAEETDKDPITGADIDRPMSKPKKAAKKKVAFSDSVDIADEKLNPAAPQADLPSRSKAKTEEPSPINDTILERASSASTTPSAPTTSAPAPAPKPKVSRFKAQRSTPVAPAEPTPPSDRLVASNVFERPTPPASAAPDPDTIDDEMHRKQLALEYHKLKSRQIHQQGGYVKHSIDGQDEGDDDDLDDWYTKNEETGAVKKLSKFKAARLK